MTPVARQIIDEVAAYYSVPADSITAPCRKKRVVLARIEVAKRLHGKGGPHYSAANIGRMLGHDHTTILFYLGKMDRRPRVALRWRKPVIRFLSRIRSLADPDAPKVDPNAPPPKPTKTARYLKPYAGADCNYHWTERPTGGHHHGQQTS